MKIKNIFKKTLCLLLVGMVSALAGGCSSKTIKNNKTTTTMEENSVTSTSNNIKKATSVSSNITTTTVEKTTATKVPSNSKEKLSNKYVDLNNRQFKVNGKIYTLGKSTLNDMIKGGCPFDENVLSEANNKVAPNSELPSLNINLGEYWNAQVNVGNFSNKTKSAKDCVLSQVYFPTHKGKTQNVISFAFPTNVSIRDLKANAGKPSNISTYKFDGYKTDKIEYKKDSTKYIGESGYTFEYSNGELKYITINYKP